MKKLLKYALSSTLLMGVAFSQAMVDVAVKTEIDSSNKQSGVSQNQNTKIKDDFLVY